LQQRRYADAVPLAREYEECSRTHFGDVHVITQHAIQMHKEALTRTHTSSERH
jgi:hypothetical protein